MTIINVLFIPEDPDEPMIWREVPNLRATFLYHEAGGAPWDVVLGNTFVTGGTDDDGETLGFPPEQLEDLHLSESVGA